MTKRPDNTVRLRLRSLRIRVGKALLKAGEYATFVEFYEHQRLLGEVDGAAFHHANRRWVPRGIDLV